MQSLKLINLLLATSKKEKHLALIKKHPDLINIQFARDLKDTYYDSWTSAPQKTLNAASALETLVEILPSNEIKALASWVRGIADLTKGKNEKAIDDLDKSASIFKQIGQEHNAAQTQVAKLTAFALLGKYDESVKTGESALKVFEKYGDELAAGKIEKNLGNILIRQGNLSKSEKYYLSARDRFQKLNDIQELTMCETNLADIYTELHSFRTAEEFYKKAMEGAKKSKMFVVEAETEASVGNLAMFRGKYDDALYFLELARQKFENLNITHRSAIAELEIADIYLELNLIDEAYQIYRKVTRSLHKLKLQREEARARASFGRVALFRNELKKAKSELVKSARLYILEKNPNGAAGVKITEAHLEFYNRKYESALKIIHEAKRLLAKADNPRQRPLANWLQGEILRNLGKHKIAEKILTETLAETEKNEQHNLARICLNSLGNLALQTDDRNSAKSYFKRAVKMIETLRAPLPAEEFRMAFLADKLAPFENLAKIYLAENNLEKAFSFTEKARARTLSESLSNDFSQAESAKDAKLSKKLGDLREELNWFYSRLNRAGTGEYETLQRQAKQREKQIADVMRQIESTQTNDVNDSANRRIINENTLENLQKSLGKQKVLIEFVNFDGSLSAFIINDEKIEFVADLAVEGEIVTLLESLHFQFGALRYGAKILSNFIGELKKRADFYLRKLYEKLIAPLEDFIGERDLVVVPVGATHYVPFHALRDDEEKYLIESREVVYAPSAAVWQILTRKPPRKIENALLIGFADQRIPLVNREIGELQEIFPSAKTFTGNAATFANYTENAPAFDILHLACHGQFRPENPLFSSLHLADGFITVRDICSQKLNAELVTLSACETGLNKIFAGDEILGLARGFLAAGANSLVLSLWTVNDEATTGLMKNFYTNLQRGENIPASLRSAQINFIKNNSHPYFWSPFMVIGK